MPFKNHHVAITGASGMPYALRLIECLLAAQCRVYVAASQVAAIVAKQEMDLTLPARAQELQAFLIQHFKVETDQLQVFGRENGAPSPPAPIRRMRWWCALAPWAPWRRSRLGWPTS